MSLFETISNEINPKSHIGVFDRMSNALSTNPVIKKQEARTNFGGIFRKFFEPDEGGRVRLRDVVRELPTGAVKTVKGIGGFTKDVAQGTARSGGSVGLSFNNLIQKIMIGGPQSNTLKIEDGGPVEVAFKKILFGDDVESLGKRIEFAPSRTTEFLSQFGIEEQKLVTSKTAPFFILGMTALDFTGAGGGGKKQIFSTIAKMNNVGDIANTLRKGINNIPEQLVDDIAIKLTKITDPNEVGKIIKQSLESVTDIVKGTKQIKLATRATDDLADFVVGEKKTIDKLFHKEYQLKARIAKGVRREPFVSTGERTIDILRGKEEFLTRLRSDSSFAQSIARKGQRTGELTLSEFDKLNLAIPRNQVDNISRFMDSVGDNLFDDVGLSLIRAGGKQGQYEYGKSLVTLYRDNIVRSGGKFDRATIHELWHSLSRALPGEDVIKFKKDYVRGVKSYIKKNPWFKEIFDFDNNVTLSTLADDQAKTLFKNYPDAKKFFSSEVGNTERKIWHFKFDNETYKFKNIDEWFSENLTDKTFQRFDEMDKITQSIFAHAKNVFNSMIKGVQRLFGRDVAGKSLDDFFNQRNIQQLRDDGLGRNLVSLKEKFEHRIPFGDDVLKTMNERGFITTMKQSPNTSPEVAKKIASNHNPLNNIETLNNARHLINTNIDEAFRFARDINAPATPQSNAVAQLLVNRAQQAKRWNEAIELAEITSKRATNPAQALQALSIWNRLTPEGILRFAKNTFDKANKINEGRKVGIFKEIKLTEKIAKDLTNRATKISKMADGEKKALETALMIAEIEKQIPATFAKKLATFQILAQLLNPKTLIRNFGGNTGFSVLENVKDVPAAALDSALSLVTGQRTKTLPSVATQLKGFNSGLKQGIRDAVLGIDTMGVPTKFDLPKTPVFKGIVGRSAEKILNVVLRGPDRAAYKAAYDGSLYQQMKAAAKKNKGIFAGEPTEKMKELAHYEGLYRTFQDDNTISRAFVALKNTVLNLGKEFGMGDIILKYPKTPGNLLARGIDYSPGGFVNTVFEATRPLMGRPFDQRAFVESFSRALVGTTGLVGTGALLHRIGIISGKREKDSDIAGVQRITGLGQYKVNASALKRFVMSGLDVESAQLQEGDKLYTYDWFQPMAIGISIGANIDENHKANATTKESIIGPAMSMIEGVAAGFNTLGEQPLVQNLTRLIKFGEIDQALLGTVKQIPRSFIPTLLSQVNQYVDNKSRNTYDPDVVKEAWNGAMQRIPGKAQDLPPRVSVFGNDLEFYQNGTNNLFNVFFNPSFRSVYKPTPEAELVLDLYSATGETKQAPRVIKKSQVINGERVKIGPKTITKMQRFVGTQSRWYFNTLARSPKFEKLSPEQKIKHMSNVLTDIGTAAKILLLGHQPKKNPSLRVQQIIAGYLINPNREELIEMEQLDKSLKEK